MTNPKPSHTPSLDFAYAYGVPSSSGIFRKEVTDFIVDEELGFEFSGEGEHLVVHIKKRGENTHWVAEKLATFFQVKTKDVGFCGRKDRHAVTTQWFSVYLPGQVVDPDWTSFIEDSELNSEVLASRRHNRKLRRGEHAANHFKIRLRDVSDIENLQSRLLDVQKNGVPNYFGEQRFGRECNNLHMAKAWIEDGLRIKNRNKRSMMLSAARSYLFNRVLSERVTQQNWQSLIEGDVEDEGRPTGPLWGRGRSPTVGPALECEQQSLAETITWCDQLEHVGLSQERRALALYANDLSWDVDGSDVNLAFYLMPGQFATSVLREICHLESVARG